MTGDPHRRARSARPVVEAAARRRAVPVRALVAGGLAVALFAGLPAVTAGQPSAGDAEVASPAAAATGAVAIAAESPTVGVGPAGRPIDRRDCTVVEGQPAEARPDAAARESLPWGPLLLGAVALNVVGSIAFTLFRHSRER